MNMVQKFKWTVYHTGNRCITYRKKGGIKKQSYLKQITREREDSIEVVDVEFDKGVKIYD